MSKIDELKFVRIIDPAVIQAIPRYLFEQIKDNDEKKIDMIYAYASEMLTLPSFNNYGQLVRVANPAIWFAIMHDISHQIKGFLWVDIDLIERHLYIQACSVDKEFQSNSGAVNRKILDYLFGLPIPDEFKQKIQMATLRPKEFERKGWKRSKNVLMEIYNESTENSKD